MQHRVLRPPGPLYTKQNADGGIAMNLGLPNSTTMSHSDFDSQCALHADGPIKDASEITF